MTDVTKKWKNEIINFKNSYLSKLLRLCAHLNVTNIKQEHFAKFDLFCKNEACVNSGTLKAISLIWLVTILLTLAEADPLIMVVAECYRK